MKKNIKIIRSTVSLATLHNRRDFLKETTTLNKTDKENQKRERQTKCLIMKSCVMQSHITQKLTT